MDGDILKSPSPAEAQRFELLPNEERWSELHSSTSQYFGLLVLSTARETKCKCSPVLQYAPRNEIGYSSTHSQPQHQTEACAGSSSKTSVPATQKTLKETTWSMPIREVIAKHGC
jgi:hypothetical protein